jgi:hypothetical protein
LGSFDGLTQLPPQAMSPAVAQWHCPDTHWAPFGQACPQAPQLVALEDTSTQRFPAQVTRGAGQAAVQRPLTQKGVVPEQVCPHPPQLLGSAELSTQLVPHKVVPPGHAPARQSPDAHELPDAHAWPQSPQCAESVRRSTHAFPQAVSPGGHPPTQWPPAQNAVMPPQMVEHEPQCCGSSKRLTDC